MKTCSKCGQEKPVEEFREINRKAGKCLMSYCRSCEREAKREWRAGYYRTEVGKAKRAEYQRRHLANLRKLAEAGRKALAEGEE